jgi:hypothetical protein
MDHKTTPIGYVLIAIALIAASAVSLIAGWFYAEYLPSGCYPVIILALPTLVTGMGIMWLGSHLLNAVGLPAFVPLCPRCHKTRRVGDCGHEFHDNRAR